MTSTPIDEIDLAERGEAEEPELGVGSMGEWPVNLRV